MKTKIEKKSADLEIGRNTKDEWKQELAGFGESKRHGCTNWPN